MARGGGGGGGGRRREGKAHEVAPAVEGGPSCLPWLASRFLFVSVGGVGVRVGLHMGLGCVERFFGHTPMNVLLLFSLKLVRVRASYSMDEGGLLELLGVCFTLRI